MYGPVISHIDDWIALLSISTRYVFDKIRDLAISEISTRGVLDPVRKITLAESYNIPHWLSPAYVDLVKRPEPLSEAEAERLGLRTMVRVARAREIVRDRKYVSTMARSYFPHDRIYAFNDGGILEIVQEVWPECVVKVPAAAATAPAPPAVPMF
ncbi:hypothetical protein EIP91_003371 [Steccherinum ochraceum]|uniref:Uncharacterized protein n=1 Tax=Steccherinum ochraceum TaxID=92696 RepID=A0A4R0RE59_9APHY|nr:hypothetical protein EIP91_003371 [Steccherinum ochraceum]